MLIFIFIFADDFFFLFLGSYSNLTEIKGNTVDCIRLIMSVCVKQRPEGNLAIDTLVIMGYIGR